MPSWRTVLPLAWAVVLAVVMLGPALGAGFVLTYDMVWVPDLALRPDFLGVGSALPRAVPSDAVVAVLDELVPGQLLQKLVLLGSLVAAGAGAARLAPQSSTSAQLVAVTLFEWNPFVGERLLMGHWPVLVGYGVLPWIVLASRRWRTTGRMPASVWWLVPLGSLSAGAGLVTAVALLAFVASASWRRWFAAVAVLVAGNAPWVVSGLLHAGAATTDPAGARVFALHGEGSLPAPLAALGLGGIWNAEAVPGSRTGLLAWVSLAVVVTLVVVGLRSFRAQVGPREAVGHAVAWGVGWGAAVLTWVAPEVMAWLVSNVPGAGLLRDGSRMLALCAPALAVVAAYGVARALQSLGSVPAVARFSAGTALVLLPVMLLPDLALGLSGRLQPVSFPTDHARAREAVARAVEGGNAGDVLVLPLRSYRQPEWNGRRKVLDPVGRFLTPDYVAGDELIVSGVRIAGEDPRVEEAARILAGPESTREQALADLGIGFVVATDRSGADAVPTARLLFFGRDLIVQRIEAASPRDPPFGWVAAMVVAWALYLGSIVLGAGVRLVINVRFSMIRD